jgi:PPOX class probable F420-dependent enzyme
MRRDESWARQRFGASRVARLATIRRDGRPRLVPVVFAVEGDRVLTAVDDKPKSSRRLARLADVALHPAVSLLVDHYAEDWTQLWWARADGNARVEDVTPRLVAALQARYPQYRSDPPPGPALVVEVTRWVGWSVA